MRQLDFENNFRNGEINMIKFTLISLYILVLGFNRCLSQSVDNSQTITNDVHLSITVATNVFQSGSSSVCITTLLNSSTNAIEINPASPNEQPSQLEISVTDDMGKFYRLTPTHSVWLGPITIVKVNPGHSFNETNAVTFYTSIKPGDYTLKAARAFMWNGKPFVTESNPVRVHIIK